MTMSDSKNTCEIERLRRLREQVKRVIEAEPELDGPMPDNVRRALADSPESMLRATVRVTKDNIAASALGLIDAAIAEAEREQVGASPAGHSTLREAFADLCHEQWTGWMRYLFSRAKMTGEGALIPYGWAHRWQRQMGKPYADLSPDEQESDRKEADRFLALLARHEPVQPEPVIQAAGYPSEPSEPAPAGAPAAIGTSDGRGMSPAGSPSVTSEPVLSEGRTPEWRECAGNEWRNTIPAGSPSVFTDLDRHYRAAHHYPVPGFTDGEMARSRATEKFLNAVLAEWPEVLRQYEREKARADAAEAKLADVLAKLQDPVAVHLNLLRGDIAKPSVWQIYHLYPEIEAAIAKIRQARVRELEAALEWLVNLGHGVGKGGTPEPGEIEAALDSGRAALTPKGQDA